MSSIQLTWEDIIITLRKHPFGALVRVPNWQIAHPIDAGMVPSTGMPMGQQADYTRRIDASTVCHVAEYGTYYDVTIAPVPQMRLPTPFAPASAPVTPGINEAGAAILATTALGALVGAIGGTKQSVATGALLGGVFGLAAVAVSNAENSPTTSETAVSMAELLAKMAHSQETSRARSDSAPKFDIDPAMRLDALRKKLRTLEEKRNEDPSERIARLLNAPNSSGPSADSQVTRKRGRNKMDPGQLPRTATKKKA